MCCFASCSLNPVYRLCPSTPSPWTNPMGRDYNHRNGSKLALPHFGPKHPTCFDGLQAYAHQRHPQAWGHAGKDKARLWIHGSSILACTLRRSCHRYIATGAHWGATSPSVHWGGCVHALEKLAAVKNNLLCLHPAQACPCCFVASGHPFQGRNHVCCSVSAACPGHPRFLQAP